MSLPPLAAFRFFDVAARTLNFARAGEQLHVTHGAVSRQIRALEASLGVTLFERRNRAVFLTSAGRQLHATVAPLFEQLEQAVYQVRRAAHDDVLVVSCEPTLAMKWLIPRLAAFHAAHPGIQVHLLAAGGPVDFVRSGVDLAVRRDDFLWGDQVHALPVCAERMGPVLAPDRDMAGLALLHSATRPEAWANWSRLSGVCTEGRARREFEHFYLSVQAATAGLGVAMVSWLMVRDELASGQLVAPHGFIEDGSAYWLLAPDKLEPGGKGSVFHEWLVGQM